MNLKEIQSLAKEELTSAPELIVKTTTPYLSEFSIKTNEVPIEAKQPSLKDEVGCVHNKGENMSNATYDIAKLTKAVSGAKKKHQEAITAAQKEARAAAEGLVERFFAEGNKSSMCTPDPVLVPTSTVGTSQYDDALAQLDLLAGDSVVANDLCVDVANLIQNAGKISTAKRSISLSIV